MDKEMQEASEQLRDAYKNFQQHLPSEIQNGGVIPTKTLDELIKGKKASEEWQEALKQYCILRWRKDGASEDKIETMLKEEGWS